LTDDELKYMKYRIRVLPKQLDLARRKVQHLEREAKRLNLHHLLGEESLPHKDTYDPA
jgi:hypothetical protein